MNIETADGRDFDLIFIGAYGKTGKKIIAGRITEKIY